MKPDDSLASKLRGSHIPTLDGLRGCSAWLVVLAHLGLLPGAFGHLGVSIFFVLSGFLITSLLAGEAEKRGSVSLSQFYMRRTLRIFPAFYAFWICCILAFWLSHQPLNWPEATASFFYFGDYYNALRSLHPVTAVLPMMVLTWSLGVEEKFYLLWPFLFRRFRERMGVLIKIAFGGIVCALVYRVSVVVLAASPGDYLYYAFDARIDNLLFGCLLALVARRETSARWQRVLAPHPASALLTLSLVAGVTFAYGYVDGRYYMSAGLTLDAILITILFVQLISWSSHWMWSWLDSRPLRFFGGISYSLYLYHWVVLVLVQYFMHSYRWRFQAAVTALASVAVATLSARFIEEPFLRLKKRFQPASGAADAMRTG
jgi:peptidoglycan/LPS O-acetylase OafA/YrhL